MIVLLVIVFVVGLAWAYCKHHSANNGIRQPTRQPTKRNYKHKPKVQSWEKQQKKVWKAKARSAMLKANYVVLSIDEANDLFTYNHSADEMKLLDVILDATLDGKDYVQIDRSLYVRAHEIREKLEKANG